MCSGGYRTLLGCQSAVGRSEKGEAYPRCDDLFRCRPGAFMYAVCSSGVFNVVISWSTSFQFKPPRDNVFGWQPPPPSHTSGPSIADIYLSQMRVTNSDADLLSSSSETVHELISCYTAR